MAVCLSNKLCLFLLTILVIVHSNNSFAFSYLKSSCSKGYGLVKSLNDSICEACPAGSYEKSENCISCPLKKVSENDGETKCSTKVCPSKSQSSIGKVLGIDVASKYRNLQIPEAGGGCRWKRFPLTGATNTMTKRLTTRRYKDGKESMIDHLPSARLVSNTLCHQDQTMQRNPRGTNLLLIYFGQFIDHDITHVTTSSELADISVPEDEYIMKDLKSIKFFRSRYVKRTRNGPREFLNTNSVWLDLSSVYGHTAEIMNKVRSFQDGLLLSSNLHNDGYDYPPLFNPDLNKTVIDCDDECRRRPYYFYCGDNRCNENLMLTAFTTVFLREHNRLARWYKAAYSLREGRVPSDEEIFQNARFRNILQYQKAVWDFLTTIVGRDSMRTLVGEYSGVKNVDPAMELHFSTIAYRFGHSAIGDLQPLAEWNKNKERFELLEEYVHLYNSFNAPEKIINNEDLVEQLLNGAAMVQHENIDSKIVTTLRNNLNRKQLDLASTNIQRGRDHGVVDYMGWRKKLSSARKNWKLRESNSFFEMTGDNETAVVLQSLYKNVMNDIDPWIAGLCEKYYKDSLLGETFTHSLLEQFSRIRDSDPFWFEQNWIKKVDGINLETVDLSEILDNNMKQGFVSVGNSFNTKSIYPVEIHEEEIVLEWIRISDDNEKLKEGCIEPVVYYIFNDIPVYISIQSDNTVEYIRWRIRNLKSKTKYEFNIKCDMKDINNIATTQVITK